MVKQRLKTLQLLLNDFQRCGSEVSHFYTPCFRGGGGGGGAGIETEHLAKIG